MSELLVLVGDHGEVLGHTIYTGSWGRGFLPTNEQPLEWTLLKAGIPTAIPIFSPDEALLAISWTVDAVWTEVGWTYRISPGDLSTRSTGNAADVERLRMLGFQITPQPHPQIGARPVRR